jgi:hypothetical protein
MNEERVYCKEEMQCESWVLDLDPTRHRSGKGRSSFKYKSKSGMKFKLVFY